MGWERGKYYTRSRKVNGRVVREYVGVGRIGELAAELDAIERDKREEEALDHRRIRAEQDDLAAMLSDLIKRCDLLTRATPSSSCAHKDSKSSTGAAEAAA